MSLTIRVSQFCFFVQQASKCIPLTTLLKMQSLILLLVVLLNAHLSSVGCDYVFDTLDLVRSINVISKVLLASHDSFAKGAFKIALGVDALEMRLSRVETGIHGIANETATRAVWQFKDVIAGLRMRVQHNRCK